MQRPQELGVVHLMVPERDEARLCMQRRSGNSTFLPSPPPFVIARRLSSSDLLVESEVRRIGEEAERTQAVDHEFGVESPSSGPAVEVGDKSLCGVVVDSC